MSIQSNNKVSIITPVYNVAGLIGETIASVLSQTYEDLEMLLVDDASTDNSWDVIQSFAEKDQRVRCWRLTQNSGAAKARNFAIEQARGRFIAFLDHDDLWLPEKLLRQVEFSLSKSAVLTHTDYEYIDASGNRIGKIIRAQPHLNYQKMLDCNYIGCLTAMYDIQKIGCKVFMPEILKRQDYALWLKILKHGHYAYGLNEVLAFYRIGRKSLSSNKIESAKFNFQLLTEIEGLSRLKAAYYFARYCMFGVKKYFLH